MVQVPLTPGSAVVLFLVGIMGAALIDVFAPRDVVRAGPGKYCSAYRTRQSLERSPCIAQN